MTGMEKRLISSGSVESQLATHWRSYDTSVGVRSENFLRNLPDTLIAVYCILL